MTDPFPGLIAATLGLEGHYSNDPADAGGETAWGVTILVARAFGYRGAMAAMTKQEAIAIYRARYWVQPRFDEVYAVDGPLGARLLDIGINMGQGTGGRFLQRALNALSSQPAMKVDGNVGTMTLTALKGFVASRGVPGRHVLLAMVVAQQTVDYIAIAEDHPADKRFLFGWELQRALMPNVA